jgi:hypothetical protein
MLDIFGRLRKMEGFVILSRCYPVGFSNAYRFHWQRKRGGGKRKKKGQSNPNGLSRYVLVLHADTPLSFLALGGIGCILHFLIVLGSSTCITAELPSSRLIVCLTVEPMNGGVWLGGDPPSTLQHGDWPGSCNAK